MSALCFILPMRKFAVFRNCMRSALVKGKTWFAFWNLTGVSWIGLNNWGNKRLIMRANKGQILRNMCKSGNCCIPNLSYFNASKFKVYSFSISWVQYCSPWIYKLYTAIKDQHQNLNIMPAHLEYAHVLKNKFLCQAKNGFFPDT